MLTYVFHLIRSDDSGVGEEFEQLNNRVLRLFVARLDGHNNRLEDELVMEVRDLELSEASGSFVHVVRRQVLTQQQPHGTHEGRDGAQSAAHAPHVVQARHAVLHREEHVSSSQCLPMNGRLVFCYKILVTRYYLAKSHSTLP